MKPIDTLLFDLDGTLVDMDRRGVTWEFLALLVPLFKGLVPAWKAYGVAKDVIRQTKTHGTDRTNFEVMVAAACAHAGASPEEVRARIRMFEERFERMAARFRPIEGARETLELAQGLGYRLALATNPSTPASMVTRRLCWAGIDQIPFAFFTHSENMTRCKPGLGYYEEMRDRWGLDPQACLMIGNEADMDLPATRLGMRTFLVDRGNRRWRASKTWTPDHVGSYADLRALLRKWAAERPSPWPGSSGAAR